MTVRDDRQSSAQHLEHRTTQEHNILSCCWWRPNQSAVSGSAFVRLFWTYTGLWWLKKKYSNMLETNQLIQSSWVALKALEKIQVKVHTFSRSLLRGIQGFVPVNDGNKCVSESEWGALYLAYSVTSGHSLCAVIVLVRLSVRGKKNCQTQFLQFWSWKGGGGGFGWCSNHLMITLSEAHRLITLERAHFENTGPDIK